VIYLTEAERRIMDILWEKSPRTFDEITREVSSEKHWTIHAVQILLKRLIQKETVREDKVLGLPVYSSGKSIQETAVISPEKAWSGFFCNETALLINPKRKRTERKDSEHEKHPSAGAGL
jgi:predicted transcriptional regulator